MDDFGVIITCHRHDYYLAKGCCASVRHFLGDVPILLLLDGDFPTDEVERTYGVQILKSCDLADVELRERSVGWGLTKMIAFWHSPWSRFLLLDADTVVWGDVRRLARFDVADMIIDNHVAQLFPPPGADDLLGRFLGPGRPKDIAKLVAHVRRWYFDPIRLGHYVPTFRVADSIGRLFCSGAVLARRGAIDRQAYLAALDGQQADPTLFGPGEMGILNFLAFHGEAEGALRLHCEPGLQTLAHMMSDSDMLGRFPVPPGGPPETVDEPTVIHWSGWQKPIARGRGARGAPMTAFRRKFLLDSGRTRAQTAAILATEDYGRMARFNGPALLEAWIAQGRRLLGALRPARAPVSKALM
ncbi:hypothetical protein ACLBXM_15660 [Xanthobacteraceae bacterium A53D]